MTGGVAGVVLASGESTRFGPANKLLARVHGVTVVERTVRAYVDAGLAPVVVVVGHQAGEIRHALAALPVQCILNTAFQRGQSRALVTGLGVLAPDTPAAVIGVADQPFLTADVVRTLVAHFKRERASMVAPRYAGTRGNPVLFERALFPELMGVRGDQGGRVVMRAHQEDIIWVDFEDHLVGLDIDTGADLEQANREER